MIAQYRALKAEHPECLLFFRLGDFYELFFEDARRAAPALDIALTRRGRLGDEDIPMCGVPVHSAESYLERLIKKGFKVAICEQTEDPAAARRRGGKALVERAVIRVVTPGTLTEDSLLEARRHNFLAALARSQKAFALAWVDISTGEFRTGPVADGTLAAELARIEPGELLVPVDRTVTGAGGRLLAARLTAPLARPEPIRRRLDAVHALVEDRALRSDLREQLRGCPDLERALSRLSLGRGGPRDLLGIATGLRRAGAIKGRLDSRGSPLAP